MESFHPNIPTKMSEDEKALRKEFDRHVDLIKSAVNPQLQENRINKAFEWLHTKLKNQADSWDGFKLESIEQLELYQNKLERMTIEAQTLQSENDSLALSKEQLKAELSRKEEMLKAAKDVIKYSNAHSPNSSLREPYFRAYQTYKTLTNGD